ncbi:MAG TPA: hypothetical protein VFI42_17405 [Thermomicrobiaceae bacterium]|nr:hypothetical protein [Thermomicrobiaceae bacterium]
MIYLVHEDRRLLEMVDTPYASEDLLQELLADYPHLLAGDQLNPAEPRRWLLVSREVDLPDNDDGASRWSIDHLFLDHSGIPTIIEVKRSSDTRIRREVIGQMLEYAANAVAYWPVEALRAAFARRCDDQGQDSDSALSDFLGLAADAEQFWQTVKTNLQAGRVRLIFVADQIPPELQRVVEFLGAQMDPAEVYAIEIKQFTGQGQRALVPRLVGGTTPKQSDGARQKHQWDEASFIQDLTRRAGTAEVEVFKRVLAWSRHHSLPPWYGKGARDGSYYPTFRHKGEPYWLFALWSYGDATIQFADMKTKPPFSDEEKRRGILSRINEIPGVRIPEERLSGYPSIPLSLLTDEAALRQFLSVFDWVVEEVRRL